MPVVFFGHGSPMNAIQDNAYTRMLSSFATKIPLPKSILCISAHWMTEGTWVTHMKNPRTIHDFFGFPETLFKVQYSALGSPKIAELVRDTVPDPKIQLDDELWGLDHGTWSVLRHIFPKAEIPVLQLSLNIAQPFSYHYDLGARLSKLRDEGVLIVGSGNIVHNLRKIQWEENSVAYPWAIEFDNWSKEKILAHDHAALVYEALEFDAGRLSIPTADHYLPLLYILGATSKDEAAHFEFEEIQNASISMRSVSFGV
jgi:4,5-DOPA dioxygenase extradiol